MATGACSPMAPRRALFFRIDGGTFCARIVENGDVRKPRDKPARMDQDRLMDMDRTPATARFRPAMPASTGGSSWRVKTTGIYCRPICPARTPKRENVSFYPSAAAAQEAGFRPCLRCRPETSPDLAFWRGTSNTVSRALALIEAGGARRGGRRGPGQAAGRRRAAVAAAVPPASRRLAGRGGADAARAARQATDPRDLAADGRGGAGVGLRQRPALQRDLPAAVRPPAGDAAARARRDQARGRRS